MDVVPIELFGMGVDVPFPAPLGFTQARLEEYGARLCDPTKGLALRHDQFRLRRTDDLYNYELTANFFGENGSIIRTADRVKLSIRNARTTGDWNVIRQTLIKFYTQMEFIPTTVSGFSSHVHAKFESVEERNRFLMPYALDRPVVRPAGLGYVRIQDWEKDIRVMIEQSNVVPNALFIAWDTQFQNNQDWDSFISSLPTVLENSANLFDIGFEPLR